jgi:cytoskeletal protein CcmA (bactofilin family)
VVIHASGKVFAEIFAPSLVVDEGGILEGVVHMARGDSSHEPTT